MDDFDPSIFEQLIPSHRDSRGLSESQSSTGSGSGSAEEGRGSGSAEEGSAISDRVYGMPTLTPIKRDHSRLSGGGESSDDIEVLGFTDRSNIGALDLSNPKRKFTKLASPMTSPTSSLQLLVQPLLSQANQKETIPPRPLHRKVVSAPKRLGQPISLGPRDSPLTLRDIKPVLSTLSPRETTSVSTVVSSSLPSPAVASSLPSLAPKPLKLPQLPLQSREGSNGATHSSENVGFGPTTIIVTPLTSSFSPTYLTIPLNRSFSMPSATFTSSSAVANTSIPSSILNTSIPSSNMPSIAALTSSYTSIAAPRPTVLSPPLNSSPLSSPTLGRYIKTEPETIIKTELDDPDDLDANNSQSTIESSQGSTHLSQASTQPMDDDDEFDQPPLTISTDEVDGVDSRDEDAASDVPKCAAMDSSSNCAGTLMALNQLNQTLDLKTMVPGPPGPHTTAEKYIIMSRLKLPYWEADEKLSWICLKHRTEIVHTTDSSTCAFCPKSKKSSGPIYVVSYRICLEYYMSEGKFLDIGRGICQACRIKTFKNLDFHDCPVVIPSDLTDRGQSSFNGLQSPILQQAGYSGLQQQPQKNRLPAREEKPISLPLNPIKIKSLAAIQPVLNSTKSFPPMRSDARNIQQMKNESRSIQPIRSDARSVQPMRSEGRIIQPMRSESRIIQPMRSESRGIQPMRSDTHSIQPIRNSDNNRNKINDLNSAIHALNPSYRPLGFSITKLSDLGPSTLSETLTATQIAMETILSSVAPGQEGELWEAVLPFITTKLINKQ